MSTRPSTVARAIPAKEFHIPNVASPVSPPGVAERDVDAPLLHIVQLRPNNL